MNQKKAVRKTTTHKRDLWWDPRMMTGEIAKSANWTVGPRPFLPLPFSSRIAAVWLRVSLEPTPNTAPAERLEHPSPEELKHLRGKSSGSDTEHPNENASCPPSNYPTARYTEWSALRHRAPTYLFNSSSLNTKRKLRIIRNSREASNTIKTGK